MKKVLFIFLVTMLFVNISNAAIYNVNCYKDQNLITYQHSSLYNHAWLYINGKERLNFWTISSGSNSITTSLNKGDNILILWFNVNEGYGQAHCIN